MGSKTPPGFHGESPADYERWFRTLDRQIRLLERERQKFSAVVNHADAGFLLFDPSARTVWGNQVFIRRFAVENSGIPHGKSCHDVLCRERTPCASCPVRRTFENGGVAHREVAIEQDGEARYLYATAMPVVSAEATVEECMVMLQDVSDLEILRRSQAALRQSEERLRHSQKMEAVGRLAGGIAHDFNNLLTAIQGYTEFLLSRTAADGELHHEALEISKAANRASVLTGQLLAFSRTQVLEPRVVDVNTAIVEMETLLRRLIGEHIELVTALQQDLGTVRVDPGQLQQVLANLAVNARDAMPEGGTLTLETYNVDLDEIPTPTHLEADPGPHVMLEVRDTGVGMDGETLSRLFEPFFTTKDRGKGTGLGLSTVYGIVEQTGGRVWCESEPGEGARFMICFPRENARPEQLLPPRVASEQQGGNETILLVEDDDAVRGLAYEVLEMNGYNVLAAANGVEALQITREYKPSIHLMLTDVVMPRMGGAELASRLAESRPTMKVLFTSGYPEGAISQRGTLPVGSAFVPKPFTPNELIRKVRESLDLP